jgi:hypothetical protein
MDPSGLGEHDIIDVEKMIEHVREARRKQDEENERRRRAEYGADSAVSFAAQNGDPIIEAVVPHGSLGILNIKSTITEKQSVVNQVVEMRNNQIAMYGAAMDAPFVVASTMRMARAIGLGRQCPTLKVGPSMGGQVVLPQRAKAVAVATSSGEDVYDLARLFPNEFGPQAARTEAIPLSPARTSPSTLHTRGVRPAPGTRVRPDGIPDGWKARPTRSGGGVEYYNPKNPNEHVRVMQGNPNSPYPNSQRPYVRQRDSSGSYLDGNGNRVPKKSPDGHIPLDQYPGYIE